MCLSSYALALETNRKRGYKVWKGENEILPEIGVRVFTVAVEALKLSEVSKTHCKLTNQSVHCCCSNLKVSSFRTPPNFEAGVVMTYYFTYSGQRKK